MVETVSSLTPAFNSSVRVELSDKRTSSDAGALALREALEASGLFRTWNRRCLTNAMPVVSCTR